MRSLIRQSWAKTLVSSQVQMNGFRIALQISSPIPTVAPINFFSFKNIFFSRSYVKPNGLHRVARTVFIYSIDTGCRHKPLYPPLNLQTTVLFYTRRIIAICPFPFPQTCLVNSGHFFFFPKAHLVQNQQFSTMVGVRIMVT